MRNNHILRNNEIFLVTPEILKPCFKKNCIFPLKASRLAHLRVREPMTRLIPQKHWRSIFCWFFTFQMVFSVKFFSVVLKKMLDLETFFAKYMATTM